MAIVENNTAGVCERGDVNRTRVAGNRDKSRGCRGKLTERTSPPGSLTSSIG